MSCRAEIQDLVQIECAPGQAVDSNTETFVDEFEGSHEGNECLSNKSYCLGYYCCFDGIQPCVDANKQFKCNRAKPTDTYWAHVDDERDLFVEGYVESRGVLFSNVGGLNVVRMTEAWLFLLRDIF